MSKNKKKWLGSVGAITLIVGFGLLAGQMVAGATEGTKVQMRVEGQTERLFEGEVTIGDCIAQDDGGTEHSLSGVALCGLVDMANSESMALSLQDFGFGLFVAGIGSDITPADWSRSWSFWVNEEPAAVGADTYPVMEGDEILFAFSGYPTVPLRVTAPEQVAAGVPFTVAVEKKIGEYDANYNWLGQWVPASTIRLWIGDNEAVIDEEGKATVKIDSPGIVDLWAEGDGLVRSARRPVIVEEGQETVGPTNTPAPTISPLVSPIVSPTISPTPSSSVTPEPVITVAPPSPTPAGGKLLIDEERKRAARAAINYLSSQQGADGKIEGDLVTAWSAIAFAADGQRGDTVKGPGGSLWAGLAAAELSSATDIERQIMAVAATGGNPRDWQGRNLVQELRGYFIGGQVGEVTIINDDIFGVLAWLAAGEPVDSSEVEQTIRTVIANRDDNGAWGSIDLTAAAVQGLREYAKRGGLINVNPVIEEARSYLRNHQDEYGGWGKNLASTAWGIQAVVSLGENPAEWPNPEGKTGWQALARYQNDNGGFGWQANQDVSSFMTAYAVPALLGKSWPITPEQAIESETSLDETTEVGLKAVPTTAIVTALPLNPMVAGIQAGDEGEISGPGEVGTREETVQADSSAQTERGPGDREVVNKFIQPNERDWQFVFSVFSLANIGIGVTVARLFIKI